MLRSLSAGWCHALALRPPMVSVWLTGTMGAAWHPTFHPTNCGCPRQIRRNRQDEEPERAGSGPLSRSRPTLGKTLSLPRLHVWVVSESDLEQVAKMRGGVAVGIGKKV